MAASDHISKAQTGDIQWRENHGGGSYHFGVTDGYTASTQHLMDGWSSSVIPRDSDKPVGQGMYRTEKRAQMAAQGVVNRAREGRDLQTGKKDGTSKKFRGKQMPDGT